MKTIKLAAPSVVNTNPLGHGAGELRHPIEGGLTVRDEEAQRLKDAGVLDGEPEDAGSGVGEDTATMNRPQLEAAALAIATSEIARADDDDLRRIIDSARDRDGDDDDHRDDMGEDLRSKNKGDLMIIVTKEGVPLHGATKNADIVAAIERHRTYRDNGLKDADPASADKNMLLVIAAYEGADVPQGDAATEDELRAAITAHRTAA